MKRILVIDEDDQMRQMLKQMLERMGYEVIDAPNGGTGIELYRQEPTDLIITNLIMSQKDGMETIIELKWDFPDVKIIAISGGSRVMDPRDYLHYTTQHRVVHTLTKPFDPQEILDAIQTVLQEGVKETSVQLLNELRQKASRSIGFDGERRTAFSESYKLVLLRQR